MILRGQISNEVLNAYVDGALNTDTAAELAARAAVEPDLAARIAVLHGLKAGVAGLAGSVPPAPPLPLPHESGRRPLWLALPAVVAACFTLAVLGLAMLGPGLFGASAPILQSTRPGDIREIFPDLRAHHDAWAQVVDESTPGAPDWLTGAMESAGLRLVHAAPLPDGNGVHLAFIGRNACRISLFERPGTGSVQGVTRHAEGELQAASWHSGSGAFTLIARDMNPQRFTTISGALAAASLTRDRTDPALLVALTAARQPCLG